MAQDLLDRFTPLHTQPINSAAIATWAITAGHRALRFTASGSRTAYFASVLSSLYNNSGILVTLVWTSPGTTAGVTWSVAFERQQASVFNYAGASFAAARSVVAGALPAANRAIYSTISFSNAQIDGLLKLESYRMTVQRTDVVAQEAYLHRVFLQNLT